MGATVITRGDAPPVLEPAEHVFHLVALLVEFSVVFDLGFTVLLGWNAGCNTLFSKGCPEPVSIITAIRKHEVDNGVRDGVNSAERERVNELERENRELRRANEILKLASAFFAQAELDRRLK